MRIWPKIKGIHFNFTVQNTLEVRLGQITMSEKFNAMPNTVEEWKEKE